MSFLQSSLSAFSMSLYFSGDGGESKNIVVDQACLLNHFLGNYLLVCPSSQRLRELCHAMYAVQLSCFRTKMVLFG